MYRVSQKADERVEAETAARRCDPKAEALDGNEGTVEAAVSAAMTTYVPQATRLPLQLCALLDRRADFVAPFGPRTVVVPHVVQT